MEDLSDRLILIVDDTKANVDVLHYSNATKQAARDRKGAT